MEAAPETAGKNMSAEGFRQIKIVHVIYRFDFGGLENGLVNLINLSPDHFQHSIITLAGLNEVFARRLKKPVNIVDVNKKPGHDVAVYWRLWKVFRSLKPDIVHTRNLSAIEAQIPAFFAAVRCRIHGEHGWDVSDPAGEVRKYQLLRRYIGMLVHRFVPLSSEIEAYLRNRAGISPNKICRICNGVDVQKFRELPVEKHPIEGVDNSRYVLISIGRLEKIKGHTWLLSALSLINSENTGMERKLQLVMVGDGSQRILLEQQVQHAGLGQVVTFLGSRSDVPELLQAADCFVLPSLAEGISNTILEAMASGLPVIATNVGGNKDLLIDGKTGCLVPPGNPEKLAAAIKTYLQEPDLGRQQGVAGRTRVLSEFSLNSMVDRYCEVYEQVTSRHLS